jgi:5-methylcytosine-specific restriction endonuclease McrA
MAKKTERKKLDEDILKLWSKCVRLRDKTCRNCNSDYNLQAHHIVQRTYKLSRYNLDNGLTLCAKCHFPEHVNPEKFRRMVTDVIGGEKYNTLHDKYMITYKWTIEELRQIKEELKAELKRLEVK